MKTKRLIFLTSANILIFTLLILLFLRCQKPIEPDIEKKPLITIEVRDRANNKPIEGASVYLGPSGEDTPLNFYGLTNQNGILQFNLDIPCSGKYYKIKIQPPSGTCYSTNEPYQQDSLLLYCCDAIKSVYFNCQYDIRCDKPISQDGNLNIEFCLDTSNTSTNISEIFKNSSNKKLKITSSYNLPNFIKLFIEGNFPNSPINLSGTTTAFNLDVSQIFYVRCNVNLNPPRTLDTIISILFEGRDDLDSLCLSLKLNIHIKANYCSQCKCPDKDTLVYAFSESLCIGEFVTKTYLFKNIKKDFKNNTSICLYKFELVKDFKNTNIMNISSIGGSSKSSFELSSNQTISQKNLNITYRIQPNYSGPVFIVDSALYRLKVRNEFGKETFCEVYFLIIDSLFLNKLSLSFDTLPSMTICEKQVYDGNICFRNRGRCNFDTAITLIVSGPDVDKFYVNRKVINNIQGNSEECVQISFTAHPEFIWDLSGNCRVPLGKTTFYINIDLKSQSSFFNGKRFTVKVNVDTSCFGVSPCIMEFDSNRVSRQEALILRDSNIAMRTMLKLKKDIDTTFELPYTIYATDFSPANNPNQCRFYAFDKNVKFKHIKSNLKMPNEQTLCTYICRDVTNQCSQPGWQDWITVREGDLIAVKIDNYKCVYIAITKILYDGVYDVHRICVAVCAETSYD